ncbi:MAG: phosphotransferase family protein [Pseudomonadota bacterium]
MAESAVDLSVETLDPYLSAHVAGFRGLQSIQKFSGGQSNPTYRLNAKSGSYVLRRKPFGELLKSAHAVDREFRVMRALAGSAVPVPQTLHLCEDDTVIGAMFFIMAFVDGSIHWDPALPDHDAEGRSKIFDEMNRILAALAAIDIDAVGLADYGKPGNYYERQIGRWTRQYRASETAPIPSMETLIDWLPANVPADDLGVSLVHGDYRLDNMVFAADGQALAVLDWELSTLGHPLADLANQCMQLRMPGNTRMRGLGGLDRAALGIPTEAAYVELFCERAGIDAIDDWPFYLAFCFFRLAGIIQGVYKRSLDGNASSTNAADYGAMVAPLANAAVELLEGRAG